MNLMTYLSLKPVTVENGRLLTPNYYSAFLLHHGILSTKSGLHTRETGGGNLKSVIINFSCEQASGSQRLNHNVDQVLYL